MSYRGSKVIQTSAELCFHPWLIGEMARKPASETNQSYLFNQTLLNRFNTRNTNNHTYLQYRDTHICTIQSIYKMHTYLYICTYLHLFTQHVHKKKFHTLGKAKTPQQNVIKNPTYSIYNKKKVFDWLIYGENANTMCFISVEARWWRSAIANRFPIAF